MFYSNVPDIQEEPIYLPEKRRKFWKPVQSKPAYTVSAFVQLQFLNWAQHHNRYHPEFFLFQVF